MSYLDENSAKQLLGMFDQLSPENQSAARIDLDAYEKSQHAAGKPMFPAFDLEQRTRRDAQEAWWIDGKEPAEITAKFADMPDAKLHGRRFASLPAFTGASPQDVAKNQGVYRAALAQAWGNPAVAKDDAAFDAEATKQFKKQRDARWLLEGNGRDDEASKALNDGAMMSHVLQSAKDGKGAGESFADWQAKNIERPEYTAVQGKDLFSEYKKAHEAASWQVVKLQSAADTIYGELAGQMQSNDPLIDTSKLTPLIEGMSPGERSMVGEMIQKKMEKLAGLGKENTISAGEKGGMQKVLEALGRPLGNLLEGNVSAETAATLNILSAAQFTEGQSVASGHENDPAALLTDALRAGRAGSYGGEYAIGHMFDPTEKLTAAQAAAANAEVDKQRRELNTRKYLLDVAQGTIDPVKGNNWVSHAGLGSLNVVSSMASFAMPGGALANTAAYIEDERARLENAGVDKGTAALQSVTVGSIQGALDKVQLSLFMRLPKLGKVLTAMAKPSASALGAVGGRLLAQGLPTAAMESGIEGAQDATPLLVQKALVALGVDEPGVEWNEIGREAWASTSETFMSMLPLVLIGVGIGGTRDFKQTQKLVNDKPSLSMLGFSEEQISHIIGAGDTKAQVKALNGTWDQRTPIYTVAQNATEQAANDAIQDPTAPMAQKVPAARYKAGMTAFQQARQEHQATADDFATAGIGIRRDEQVDGSTVWKVRDTESGVTTEHPDYDSAWQMASHHMTENLISREAPFMDALQQYMQAMPAGREMVVTNESGTLADQLEKATAAGDAKSMQDLWNRAQIERSRRGESPLVEDASHPESAASLADMMVLGKSYTHFQEKVGRSVATVYRHGNGIDLVEEMAESDMKEHVGGDAARLAGMESAIAHVESVTGDKYQHGSGLVAVTEAWSSLVRLYTTGTRKQAGNAITKGARAGIIEDARMRYRALKAAESSGASPELFARLREYFELFKATMARVARLMKAKAEGKLDADVESMIRKSIGLDEMHQHVQEVAQIAQEEAGPVGLVKQEGGGMFDPAEADLGFSLGKGRGNGESGGMENDAAKGEHGFSLGTRVGRLPLPDVRLVTRLGAFHKHPDFDAAKRGDDRAAMRLAHEFISDGFLEELRGSLGSLHPRILPVTAFEGQGTNVLPLQAANFISEKLGMPIETEIVQSSRANRSSMSGLDRVFRRVAFDSPGEVAGDYLLLDDTLTQGGTLADLAHFIHARGGRVVGMVALTGHDYSARLALSDKLLADIREKYGDIEAEFIRSAGHGYEQLTESEARTLLSWKPAESVRNRILAPSEPGGSATGEGVSEGTPGAEGGELGFSIAPTAHMELLARSAASHVADPSARLEIWAKVHDQLQGMARAIAHNDKVDGMVSAHEIERERIKRKREALAVAFAKIDEAFPHLTESEYLSTMANNPLLSEFFRYEKGKPPRGRMRSRASAERHGDVKGDYDGADAVPWYFFQGSEKPDSVLTGLQQEGLMGPDTNVSDMFERIAKELSSVAKHKKALSQYAQDRFEARQRITEETNAWAEQERAALPTRAPERAAKDQRRFMAALDYILMQFPVEVRDKVGGFAQLANLETNAQRTSFILRRIERLDHVLENFLTDEFTAGMHELVEQAKAKREPGKKPRGKLGAAGHRYFDLVEHVMGLNTTEVAAFRAGIVDEMGREETTPERALELWEQEQVLDTYGNWSNKSASEMGKALEQGWDVYRDRRNKRLQVEMARIADVKALTAATVEALGGVNVAASQAQKAKAKKALKILGVGALDLKSFSELMTALLGRGNPLAKRWADAARRGMAQKTDEVLATNRRWKDALYKATGKRGVAARRRLWEMSQEQSLTISKALQTTTKVDEVPVTLIDQWAAGKADPEALGLSPFEARQLMDDRAAMSAKDRRQSIPVERSQRVGEESVKMTEAEGVFLLMLSAQDQYRASLDKAGWDHQAISQIEENLSPAALKLRDFMAREYQENYAPLAALMDHMFGVNLPQLKNYSPGAFYNLGADKAMDPTNTGTVEGGMRDGFLMSRKSHAAAPKLENAFAKFFGHAHQTAHWKAMAELTRELRGVFGNPEVKQSMNARHGEAMGMAVNQWMRALEGNGLAKEAGLLDKAVGWLTTSQAYIALAFKLGTLVKQSTALLGAAYKIPTSAYLRGLGKLLTGQLDVSMIYNTDFIQRRMESGYSPEVRAAMHEVWNAKPTRRKAMLEAGMQFIGLTDAFFTTGSASIAYDYYFQEAKKEGMPDATAQLLAMEQAERVVSETAQPAEVSDRSLFELQQGAMGRLLFMFASEARQKSSLLAAAWGNTLTGKATAADVRVLVLSHLIVGPLVQAMTAMIRDLRDDDDDEVFDAEHWNVSDFLKAAVAGPLGGIPLLGEALSGFRNDGILGRFKHAGSSLHDLFIDGIPEKEDEPVEWYVNRIAKVLQGTSAELGVLGSVVDQVFDFADNAFTDDVEQAGMDKRESTKEKKESKAAGK